MQEPKKDHLPPYEGTTLPGPILPGERAGLRGGPMPWARLATAPGPRPLPTANCPLPTSPAPAPADLRALSVRQPWAWLIVHEWKPVENRPWTTRRRGRILIHAAKGATRGEYEAAVLFVRGFAPLLADRIPPLEELPRGGIVGEAEILDCVEHHPSEWFTGPRGLVLADARPLPFVPCKGALGFFRVPDPGTSTTTQELTP